MALGKADDRAGTRWSRRSATPRPPGRRRRPAGQRLPVRQPAGGGRVAVLAPAATAPRPAAGPARRWPPSRPDAGPPPAPTDADTLLAGSLEGAGRPVRPGPAPGRGRLLRRPRPRPRAGRGDRPGLRPDEGPDPRRPGRRRGRRRRRGDRQHGRPEPGPEVTRGSPSRCSSGATATRAGGPS